MKKIRLTALDGLRGIAILLVIFNHIPLKIWYESINTNFHQFLDVLLLNGKFGVSILFLLTGFLMAWLYPRPKSKIAFWSRRYARLFPAFLVMVVSLTIIRINGNLSIVKQILTILSVGIIARIIWILVLKIGREIPIGKILTYFWMSFQVIVAFWYVFFLLKIPSPIFYQTWDKNLQWIITGIINATLTLPFGNYIGQLDGVYWSLITETFFYILYPILFVPFFLYINKKKSIKWKTFLLLFTFLFCYSLNFISQRILAMQMMFLSLTIYFIVGVMIGSNLDWCQKKFLKLPKLVLKPVFLIPVLLIVLSGVFVYPNINKNIQPMVPILLTIPMGFLLVATTFGEKSWGKYLENKFLVFLGKYSYALYLTHALVIDLAVKIVQPNSILNSFVLILVVTIGSILLAWCLYHLIEAPYYNLPKISINLEKNETIKVIGNKFKKTIFWFSLINFLILILAFKTPFSLFTYSFSHQTGLSNLFKKNLLLTTDETLRYEFYGKEDNLGMITTNIKSIKNIDQQNSSLKVKLINSENKTISQSTFDINNMVENNFYPFGFPIQPDSKNKKYIIEYKIEPRNSLDKIEISEKENQFISVYFLNKIDLIKNPRIFVWWFLNKTREPFLNKFFWIYLTLTLPLILFLIKKDEK
ncbi:MAG: acyltransferase [Candidatus Shapirobacteria bacterium]